MVMVVGLVVLQNLSQLQSGVLADAVQLADGIDGGMALAGDGVQCLTLLYLVQMCAADGCHLWLAGAMPVLNR